MDEPTSKALQIEAATLEEVVAGGGSAARAAAALIQAGVPAATRVAELRPGSVTATLAETCARELAELYGKLDDVYSSAFVGTATDNDGSASGPPRRLPWWRRLVRRR